MSASHHERAAELLRLRMQRSGGYTRDEAIWIEADQSLTLSAPANVERASDGETAGDGVTRDPELFCLDCGDPYAMPGNEPQLDVCEDRGNPVCFLKTRLKQSEREAVELRKELANSRALSDALGEEWRRAGVIAERDELKTKLTESHAALAEAQGKLAELTKLWTKEGADLKIRVYSTELKLEEAESLLMLFAGAPTASDAPWSEVEAWAQKRQPAAPEPVGGEPAKPPQQGERRPVCSSCNDTHRVDFGGSARLCVSCPVPCEKCRANGNGAYCGEPRCKCECHQKPAQAEQTERCVCGHHSDAHTQGTGQCHVTACLCAGFDSPKDSEAADSTAGDRGGFRVGQPVKFWMGIGTVDARPATPGHTWVRLTESGALVCPPTRLLEPDNTAGSNEDLLHQAVDERDLGERTCERTLRVELGGYRNRKRELDQELASKLDDIVQLRAENEGLKEGIANATEEARLYLAQREKLADWQRSVRTSIRAGHPGFAALDQANTEEFAAQQPAEAAPVAKKETTTDRFAAALYKEHTREVGPKDININGKPDGASLDAGGSQDGVAPTAQQTGQPIIAAPVAKGEATAESECLCWRCLDAKGANYAGMVLCPRCGNKRCPKANDHNNECSGSNEPGQPGSAYAAQKLALSTEEREVLCPALLGHASIEQGYRCLSCGFRPAPQPPATTGEEPSDIEQRVLDLHRKVVAESVNALRSDVVAALRLCGEQRFSVPDARLLARQVADQLEGTKK